ncbi:MAG TPA: FHA domain-containing protein [Anaerolineae bacterium]|nr:FHA domain-containing protein [Anaerolineae bacterium]HMR63220.1 FHA domain-containing protein [Anaerolineae bacterium]
MLLTLRFSFRIDQIMLYNRAGTFFTGKLNSHFKLVSAMVDCPFCRSEQVDNSIYCSECGHYLLDEGNLRKTEQYDIETVLMAVGPALGPGGDLSTRLVGATKVHLTFGTSGRQIELPLRKVLLVGRVDPALEVFPDIDVTLDGPEAKSVSRRHATIARQGDKIVVEDLGSVNGTLVNGRRLDPYLPSTLRDGDTLQLGKLQINVKIQSN